MIVAESSLAGEQGVRMAPPDPTASRALWVAKVLTPSEMETAVPGLPGSAQVAMAEQADQEELGHPVELASARFRARAPAEEVALRELSADAAGPAREEQTAAVVPWASMPEPRCSTGVTSRMSGTSVSMAWMELPGLTESEVVVVVVVVETSPGPYRHVRLNREREEAVEVGEALQEPLGVADGLEAPRWRSMLSVAWLRC